MDPEPTEPAKTELPAERSLSPGVVRRWSWHGGELAAVGEFIGLQRHLWALTPVPSRNCMPFQSGVSNALFFVLKKNPQRLRKIIGAVPANEACVDPPAVDLPGPWVLRHMRFREPSFFVAESRHLQRSKGDP